MARAYAVTVGAPPAGQSAVALTPVDGETIAGGVQSNFTGQGFYTRNGFSRAADWTGPKPGGGVYAGFDDPAFLPLVTWLTDFGGDAATGYDRMDDLGLNGMMPASGAIDLDTNVSRGKWSVVTNEPFRAVITAAQDPGVVGVSTGEEPSAVVQYETIRGNADTWMAGPEGAGRFHVFNFADGLLNGEVEHVYFPRDMVIGWVSGDGANRGRRQYTTCDQYWFAGAIPGGQSPFKLDLRLYPSGVTPTVDQSARGCHYGSMLDSIRKRHAEAPNNPPGGPIGIWIEAAAPYEEAATLAPTPAQLKWAVWATLVHGARSVQYFVHHFRAGDVGAGPAFWSDYHGGPGVPGDGIYAAAREVNLRALQIAHVINAPFDGYFAFGDGGPLAPGTGAIATPGFLTAVTSTNARAAYAGVDACCKWQPAEARHYILATTRESGTATNVPIVCRMVDQGQTQAAPVFGGPPIPIQRGGGVPAGFCEFTDTFATGADYKCWRID